MQLSEIRINLCGPQAGRLKAFCSLTFDNTFVIRDVKIIEGNDEEGCAQTGNHKAEAGTRAQARQSGMNDSTR